MVRISGSEGAGFLLQRADFDSCNFAYHQTDDGNVFVDGMQFYEQLCHTTKRYFPLMTLRRFHPSPSIKMLSTVCQDLLFDYGAHRYHGYFTLLFLFQMAKRSSCRNNPRACQR